LAGLEGGETNYIWGEGLFPEKKQTLWEGGQTLVSGCQNKANYITDNKIHQHKKNNL
jgi:hypothetical protein